LKGREFLTSLGGVTASVSIRSAASLAEFVRMMKRYYSNGFWRVANEWAEKREVGK